MSAVRTTSRLAFAAFGVALLVLAAPPAAGAQEDPYGSTTTTAPGGGGGEDPRDGLVATCDLTVSEGRPGDSVTATVHQVFFGENVRIFFDSIEVGSTTAPLAAQSAGAPVLLGGTALAAQPATTSVQVTFTIPPAAPGEHIITAVGDTFTCFCNPDGVFDVLAAQGAGGSLARTGIYAGVLVAVALALLVTGRGLVVAARRRRGRRSNPFIDEDSDAGRGHSVGAGRN